MKARRDHCIALLLLGVLSACGTSELETSLFGSNGSPDAVPPIPGTVRDGISGDITAQVSTTTLAANWHSFLDTQSGIARYEWAAGQSGVAAWYCLTSNCPIITDCVASGSEKSVDKAEVWLVWKNGLTSSPLSSLTTTLSGSSEAVCTQLKPVPATETLSPAQTS